MKINLLVLVFNYMTESVKESKKGERKFMPYGKLLSELTKITLKKSQ